MKVMVTGASGFIGSHLIRELVKKQYEIVCLVRKTSRIDHLKDLPLEWKIGDLRDLASLRAALDGSRVLYHCAADYRFWCKNTDEMYQTNVRGTANALQCAYEAGVDRVVYTSTVGVLGYHQDGRPANEHTGAGLHEMVGAYKRSKFLAEREAEDWVRRGLPVVIVQPSAPIGELDHKPTPTGKMIVDFLRHKMFAYLDTGMNLIDVQDVAKGHVLAAEKGKIGEKYILGNSNLTLKEIFDRLSGITGIPSPIRKIPYCVALLYAKMENTWTGGLAGREPLVPVESVRLAKHKMWFDSSKAVRELGLPQTPVDEALNRAVQWFQQNGYANN
ncbi:MAG TPA: hopanoid-associated sugar epimerase [Acidobacteriota bacterium]|nr:hopanoid-associated sugar epimerase [Acidobacteriota bacterium]